jgi:hypothetical protein
MAGELSKATETPMRIPESDESLKSEHLITPNAAGHSLARRKKIPAEDRSSAGTLFFPHNSE